MAKIEINKTELVWPGKYNDDGTRREVPRANLPFQVIETINESRATREVKNAPQQTLFDVYQGKEGTTFEEGWRNKLIWGDNLLVMSSLLEKFSGKIDLIYIDPPFATGADFSFRAEIGEGSLQIDKESSIIEEKAYRDTWGKGLDSYIDMIFKRFCLMRDLLAETGSIYVHLDEHVVHYVKPILDELFGRDNFRNDIAWRRVSAHNDPKRYGMVLDNILFYTKSEEYFWSEPKIEYEDWYIERYYRYKDKDGRKFLSRDLTAPGGRGPIYKWKGIERAWRLTIENMKKLENEDRIFYTENGIPRYKQYLEEMNGTPLQNLWDDIQPIVSWSSEGVDYSTQKPEDLLERILLASSKTGDLVADFFSGSGTTLSVAERLGRRWIGCDLGRYGVHTSRKRLLEIENCKSFELLNLGKYERQYWQNIRFSSKGNFAVEKTFYEYLSFVLKLYGAQPITGSEHLHGKRGKAMIHIGAVDAPVTIDEITKAMDECEKSKQDELHVLGWEWEMGLAGPNNGVRKGGPMHEIAKQRGLKLVLLQIPNEAMEQQAVDKGDIQFFELAYLQVEIETPEKQTARVHFKDFVIPNTELIPEEVRSKIKKWSDYVDYWAVDWDFRNDTFMQGWVTYRTRKDRKLELVSDTHKYPKAGKYRIFVKVVDIFGNDTSQAFDVEVK